jgi:hypothetical protein
MNKRVAVRQLVQGDTLLGSGFVVTRTPWAGVRTPKGKMVVEGHYPGSPVRAHEWNANTVVTTLDKTPTHW